MAELSLTSWERLVTVRGHVGRQSVVAALPAVVVTCHRLFDVGAGHCGQGARWHSGKVAATRRLCVLRHRRSVGVASERGAVSANLHRPFSLATQLCLLLALVHHWKSPQRPLRWLNAAAWGGILADTALHVLMVRHW